MTPDEQAMMQFAYYGITRLEDEMKAEQIALFDYQQLDTETRIIVQQRTSEIKALMKRTAQDIIEIGEKLIEVKERLGHGNFGGWLEAEFKWSYPTAAKIMSVAKQFKSINFIDLEIAPSALYLLSAPSAPIEARQEAIERANNGETITHAIAKDIIGIHKTIKPIVKETPIPVDNRPLFDDPHLDAALEDEDKPFCPNCQQVYDGSACPSCRPKSEQQLQVLLSHEETEWYTPEIYIDLAKEVMGEIDLDPASCDMAQTWINAKQFFTKEQNGLNQDWHGRVWLNPPYSTTDGQSNQDLWSQRLIAQYKGGSVSEAILLVKASIGYNWFDALFKAYPVCFMEGLISFIKPDGTPGGKAKLGSAFFYFGDNFEKFNLVFSKIGRVIAPK